MQNREVHTRESFIEAQLDIVSPTARSLLPLVGSELWYSQPMGEVGSKQRLRFDAVSMLASWNGEMNEHLPEPLIYSTWMKFLQKRLMRQDKWSKGKMVIFLLDQRKDWFMQCAIKMVTEKLMMLRSLLKI